MQSFASKQPKPFTFKLHVMYHVYLSNLTMALKRPVLLKHTARFHLFNRHILFGPGMQTFSNPV